MAYYPYPYAEPQRMTLQRVKSRDEALSVTSIPPNSALPCFHDSEAVFYIVTTDAIGTKSVHEYTYAPVVVEPPAEQRYVTYDEMAGMLSELKELIADGNGVRCDSDTAEPKGRSAVPTKRNQKLHPGQES